MTYWGDRVAEIEAQQAPALPDPTIPQTQAPAEPVGMESY